MRRKAGNPGLRQEMREIDRACLRMAVSVGDAHAAAIFKRHVTAIESGLQFKCPVRDLPFRLPGIDPNELVLVTENGTVELLEELQ